MKDQLIKAISSGLRGKWTHIEPKKALKGLIPTNARKKPAQAAHSCWELLHHVVVWQDAIIKQIKGETVDWNEIVENDDWPTTEAIQDDSNFIKLVDRFYSGIEEAKRLLNSVDLTKTSIIGKDLPELSTIKLYITLLQHTSYHLGQIITVRKCLGDWPPSDTNS
ncbi:MAG: DinB family protein [Candidatus Hodarchaeales archaeon]|jgi:uncharacterized damage-inducible protein DinB